jgi:tetraacyldisaccharide 4'-kinase
MRAPAFWWRPGSARSALLAPIGALVGRIAAKRMAKPGALPPLPVICVGNFVVGGAGKTPTAVALAGLAAELGLRTVFLTRGYGGRLSGPLIVDPDLHSATDVGDEALLLARVAPTVVSRDRIAAFPLLASFGAALCLMDDGFQNPSVIKSRSLVVVDGEVGIGTGRVMPAGPLRAPMNQQMPRADAVVIVGSGEPARLVVRAAARGGKRVFRAHLQQRGGEVLRGERVFAYSGIGRPEKFFSALEGSGATVVGTRAFPDHHPYTSLDAREILNRAQDLGALPVTTVKDAVRLAHAAAGPKAELASRSVAVDVECRFEAPDQVREFIKSAREAWLRQSAVRV